MNSAFDNEGRCWPGAGIQHTRAISLAELEAAGVVVTWTKPDGVTPMDPDAARLLIAARQSDADQGIRPIFPAMTECVDAADPPAPDPVPAPAPAPDPVPAPAPASAEPTA